MFVSIRWSQVQNFSLDSLSPPERARHAFSSLRCQGTDVKMVKQQRTKETPPKLQRERGPLRPPLSPLKRNLPFSSFPSKLLPTLTHPPLSCSSPFISHHHHYTRTPSMPSASSAFLTPTSLDRSPKSLKEKNRMSSSSSSSERVDNWVAKLPHGLAVFTGESYNRPLRRRRVGQRQKREVEERWKRRERPVWLPKIDAAWLFSRPLLSDEVDIQPSSGRGKGRAKTPSFYFRWVVAKEGSNFLVIQHSVLPECPELISSPPSPLFCSRNHRLPGFLQLALALEPCSLEPFVTSSPPGQPSSFKNHSSTLAFPFEPSLEFQSPSARPSPLAVERVRRLGRDDPQDDPGLGSGRSHGYPLHRQVQEEQSYERRERERVASPRRRSPVGEQVSSLCLSQSVGKAMLTYFFFLLLRTLDDSAYTNKTWSEVSHIDLEDLNRMER